MFSSDNPTSAMDLFCVVVSVIALGIGVYQIYKKQLFGQRNKEYTKESITKFAPIEGILYVVLGAMGVLISLTGYGIFPMWTYWPGVGLIIVGLVADAILIKKKLVPKKKKNDINVEKHMLR